MPLAGIIERDFEDIPITGTEGLLRGIRRGSGAGQLESQMRVSEPGTFLCLLVPVPQAAGPNPADTKNRRDFEEYDAT